MDERVFLSDRGVEVTSSRIVIDGQTFATRNVGSVVLQQKPTGYAPVLLGFVGVAGGLQRSEAGYIIAATFLAGAAYLWWTRYSERTLVMMAGGGEVKALTTRDEAWAVRVRDAVASAIAAR